MASPELVQSDYESEQEKVLSGNEREDYSFDVDYDPVSNHFNHHQDEYQAEVEENKEKENNKEKDNERESERKRKKNEWKSENERDPFASILLEGDLDQPENINFLENDPSRMNTNINNNNNNNNNSINKNMGSNKDTNNSDNLNKNNLSQHSVVGGGGVGGSSNLPFAVLECKLDRTDFILTLLNTLIIENKPQIVLISCGIGGLSFSVLKSNCLSAKAILKSACFSKYIFRPRLQQGSQALSGSQSSQRVNQSVSFSISLNGLISCLSLFPPTAFVEFIYKGSGYPLLLKLIDEGVVSDCEIDSIQSDSLENNSFLNQAQSDSGWVAQGVIINPACLKGAFAEVDINGATSLTIRTELRPPIMEPRLVISSKGDAYEVSVELPNSKQIFSKFDALQDKSFSYSLNLLRPCIRALAAAETTNFNISTEGLLTLQHLIRVEENLANWIQYKQMAEVDENENENEKEKEEVKDKDKGKEKEKENHSDYQYHSQSDRF